MRRILSWFIARSEAKSKERARELCGNPCTNQDARVGRGMGVCLHCGNLLIPVQTDRDD